MIQFHWSTVALPFHCRAFAPCAVEPGTCSDVLKFLVSALEPKLIRGQALDALQAAASAPQTIEAATQMRDALLSSLHGAGEEASGSRRAAVRRVIWRGLLLWLIGIIYYGGISNGLYDAETNKGVRLLGVLQRIGICYLVAGLLFIYLPVRGLVMAFLVLLAGYWALLSFVAAPGQEMVSFEAGRNITNWFDSKYLPFAKWSGTYDPEGILSTLPSIATCLLGVFVGLLLKNKKLTRGKRVLIFFGVGFIFVLCGHLWGGYHPVIKSLWTSSFVILAGGWSLILLAFFYLVIDVVNIKKWAMPFVWIGMNPIMIYLLSTVLDFNHIAKRVLGGSVGDWADGILPGLGALLIAVGGIFLIFWLCQTLYKRKVFLRI